MARLTVVVEGDLVELLELTVALGVLHRRLPGLTMRVLQHERALTCDGPGGCGQDLLLHKGWWICPTRECSRYGDALYEVLPSEVPA